VTPWREEDAYPISIEATIALLWVTMVAAMPFIVIKLEGKDFTRVQAVVFFIMWVILFGGVYLFTQVLYFTSAHFDTIRRLTVVESVYFLSQVLTTVGYGDVTPAMPRAQVFVALYVLFSLLVIANVISEVGACISKHVRKVGKEMVERYRQAHQFVDDVGFGLTGSRMSDALGTDDNAPTPDASMTPRMRMKQRPVSYFELTPPTLDFLSVVGATGQFAFFVVLGVCFFHNYPGEDKPVFDAIYMSVITLSTVGFGVITPQTEAGKVFGAFWMLFGSGALVGLVGSLTDLYGQIKVREIWYQRNIEQERQDFMDSLPENVDKYEFFKKSLLFKGAVQEEDLKALEAIFDHLNKREDGKIAKAEVTELLAVEEPKSST
jgi:voltage-gated potassium channel Kch